MTKTKDHNQADTEQCPESAANVDWDALFREFFDSPFFVVRDFLKLRLGPRIATSGWVKDKVTGWPEEKKALIKQMEKRALERVKDYKEEKLVLAKKLYIQEMTDRIVTRGPSLSHKEMASNLRAIKTELGEPSIITKQNIVEQPLDDDQIFNDLMEDYEKHTAPAPTRSASKGDQRKQGVHAKPSSKKARAVQTR